MRFKGAALKCKILHETGENGGDALGHKQCYAWFTRFRSSRQSLTVPTRSSTSTDDTRDSKCSVIF